MAKLSAPIIILLMILIMTACSSSSSSNLVDQSWLLTTVLGEQPLPGTIITLEFGEGGKVGGSSGCNRYSASYTFDGNQLSFGEQMATTMMACLEPVMQQEREYLQVLAGTKTFQLEDDVLTLFDGDGEEVASFVLISQSLAGTSWTVIGYNNGRGGVVSLISGTEITANFTDDGRISGNSGCNTYSAQFETQDGKINIGTAEVTEMACIEPEGVMEQEKLYLAALEMAENYKVQGGTMEMRTSQGSLVANFQRVP